MGANGLVVDHVLHSEAVASKRHWLGEVQEPVEDGRGHGGVVIEDFRPVLVHAIRRDRDGTSLVALADDLEQQVGADLVDGVITELVEDQQSGAEVAGEIVIELPGGLGPTSVPAGAA